MLILKTISENQEEIIKRLAVKNFDGKEIIQKISDIDILRRQTQKLNDNRLAEMNSLSKEIGNLFKAGKQQEAETAKQRTADLKEEIKVLSQKLHDYETQINALLVQVPNTPHVSVAPGKTAEENTLVKGPVGILENNSATLPHWELAKKFNIIDFELGNKLTGSGFPVYLGKGAKLQRALVSYFLDAAGKAGYSEVQPPYMVNEDSAFGTCQLPDKEGQMYHIAADNFFLIPTAEVPVTNIFRDEILDMKDLPRKITAYTPCFRREAGSYGKDTRGLNRVHQFDKVEIVQIEQPEKSYAALEEMSNHVESLLISLGLPYRIVRLCGGEMSFASALTYDFEVYAMAQKRWLEVSSVSNFETFQSNRLKLRFRDSDKKTQLAHTLNGSALALPRILASILENYQDEQGITIPACLVPYTGFDRIA